MIAAHVENHGVIRATNGTVGIAAGQSVQLTDSAHPQLLVRATSDSLGGTGLLNSGLIDAARVELLANGGNVYGLAINNTGTIRATGAETRDGRIFLVSAGGKIAWGQTDRLYISGGFGLFDSLREIIQIGRFFNDIQGAESDGFVAFFLGHVTGKQDDLQIGSYF